MVTRVRLTRHTRLAACEHIIAPHITVTLSSTSLTSMLKLCCAEFLCQRGERKRQ